MHRAIPPLLLVTTALACASGGQHTVAAKCPPATTIKELPGQSVYEACAVDEQAQAPMRPSRIDYTPPPSVSCVVATVDIVVDSSGWPLRSTAKLVRSTDPAFLDAVLASLEKTRYRPAHKDGRAVPQIVRAGQAFTVERVVVSGRGTAPPTSSRPPRLPAGC